MTSAPDGDVERALAAMGATPLKYYSFGVVAVRPPEPEHKIPSSGVATTPTLPLSGEGTIEQYRVHAVSNVFPLLGLALPEAFHIDVEPVWPVGPPISDQGILLDRNGNAASRFAGLSHPAFIKEPLPKTSVYPKTYSSIGDGAPDTPANAVPFVMPAWLDPTRSAEFALTQATPPSPSTANLFAWLDTNSSAPSPVAPNEPPSAYSDHVSSDAREPPGVITQRPEAENPQGYHTPPSFSPFGQPAHPADHPPSVEDSVSPSVQMSPHWLDMIAHAQSPVDEVKLADWSAEARDARVHQPLSAVAQTTPEPITLTDHKAAAPSVVHPVQTEPLHADATSAGMEANGFELRPLPEPVAPKWHEPPSEGPSDLATAPSHGAGDVFSAAKAAAMSPSAMPTASMPGGADNWQGVYQWSTSDISTVSATQDATGARPAPSPSLSTDASPNLSTDASPSLSTDASPHLPNEAPLTSRRNGSRPLAEMFRTLGGGGANPMK